MNELTSRQNSRRVNDTKLRSILITEVDATDPVFAMNPDEDNEGNSSV